jgi:RNA polymerase sigma-70 factor (ECF subfamily)
MSALSDESLLAGLGSGDPEAAAVFVRRFQSRVFGLALTVLHDREAAEEVAQETFVRAWRHAATFDPRRGRVAPWLLTIARNLAIDAARVKPAVPADPDVVVAALDNSAQETMPEIDERDRVRAAVADLPADQRRALVLAAYAGRTAREIGELDGIALGTVKTRIRTAMLRLREALEVGRGL